MYIARVWLALELPHAEGEAVTYLAIFIAAWAGVWCAEHLTWQDVEALWLLPLYLLDRIRGRI